MLQEEQSPEQMAKLCPKPLAGASPTQSSESGRLSCRHWEGLVTALRCPPAAHRPRSPVLVLPLILILLILTPLPKARTHLQAARRGAAGAERLSAAGCSCLLPRAALQKASQRSGRRGWGHVFSCGTGAVALHHSPVLCRQFLFHARAYPLLSSLTSV